MRQCFPSKCLYSHPRQQVSKLIIEVSCQLMSTYTSMHVGVYPFTGLDYWTGLANWTTGLT